MSLTTLHVPNLSTTVKAFRHGTAGGVSARILLLSKPAKLTSASEGLHNEGFEM
jgi:hypothetical protein